MSKLILPILSILLVVSVSGLSYADAWIDGTPMLYEESRFLAQFAGQDSRAMRAPSADTIKTPAYKVGDVRQFYAINMINGSQYILSASCYAVSDRAYIFVERGRSVTYNRVTSLLKSFDSIYDNIKEQFGPPPDSIDGDPRIYLLIMDILDSTQPNGAKMLGYFNPIDQFRNTQLFPWTRRRSNEVEILYIDYISLSLKSNEAESVIAHEFTHLVQWGMDPEESTWVNEGIAVYVESALGYDVASRISAFERNPNTSLLDWSGSLESYGAVYLFFAYISEKFGGAPIISAILRSKKQGIEGIEQALAATGKHVSFDRVFSNWVIANYLDDPDLGDGSYGYSTLDVHLTPSIVEAQYPITRKTSRVLSWAAQYTEFRKGQDDLLVLTIYDDDEDDIKAQVIRFGNGGKIDVSAIEFGDARSGTISISQKDSKVVLVVTSQPNPPDAKKGDSVYIYSAETRAFIASVTPLASKKVTTWGSIKSN